MKDTHSKNCKTLVKAKIQTDIPRPWSRKINTVKMTKYYQRQSTDSVQSLSNHQQHFSQNYNQKKFLNCMETQKTLNHQNNLEKEKQSWRTQAP